MKKLTALALALMLLLSMAGIASAEEPRHIIIGTTWDHFYDSTHTDVYDNPGYTGELSQDMMFEHVKYVEQKWNVTFEFLNMTYSGSKESLNTSVLAGTPDVDVYMVDLAVGAPAIANGYAVDMRDILPADDPLLTGTDVVMSYIDVGNGSACMLIPNKKENMVANTKPLAFNLQMIEDANLEDPRDLELQDHNFNVMYEMGLKQQFEMWNNLGVGMELTALINGEYTVAQYQEMFKQPVQDALTALMGE